MDSIITFEKPSFVELKTETSRFEIMVGTSALFPRK